MGDYHKEGNYGTEAGTLLAVRDRSLLREEGAQLSSLLERDWFGYPRGLPISLLVKETDFSPSLSFTAWSHSSKFSKVMKQG